MFQLGELVVYGVHGVCRVSQIQEQVVDRIPRQYLVLEPVSKSGSQYMVPMHNAVAMNKLTQLLSPEELEGDCLGRHLGNVEKELPNPYLSVCLCNRLVFQKILL